MFKRLVQLFFLLVLVAVAGLVWFSWYASTPLLVPVGAAESSASGESMIMEPVETVSADGTAIAGYLVRPRLSGTLTPRQNRVRDALKLRGNMTHLDEKPELVRMLPPCSTPWRRKRAVCRLWPPWGRGSGRLCC